MIFDPSRADLFAASNPCFAAPSLRSFPFENFQFFCGSSSRSRTRRFCSFFETLRKNFGMTTPFRVR
jgi:hypothetical protein